MVHKRLAGLGLRDPGRGGAVADQHGHVGGLFGARKEGEAGEDDVRRAEKQLDDATHKQVEHIDEVLKHKEAELLEV